MVKQILSQPVQIGGRGKGTSALNNIKQKPCPLQEVSKPEDPKPRNTKTVKVNNPDGQVMVKT